MTTTWEHDSIQFPRLLAELRAAGLTSEQYADLADSMDLSVEAIDELLERAEGEWERIKGRTTGDGYQFLRAKLVSEITVQDPDSNLPVEVAIYKEESGGMFGVDASYLEQVADGEDDPVPSVFGHGLVLLDE